MSNHFQATSENPFHVSIGGILRNEEGKIAAHYFEHFSHPAFGDIQDFYILMRETIEPGESIEEALMRGFMEEFGATADLVSYRGAIVSRFPKRDVLVEKTTLYFLCDLVDIDESRRAENDLEAASEIRWIDARELAILMKEQFKRIGREDLDESKILESL